MRLTPSPTGWFLPFRAVALIAAATTACGGDNVAVPPDPEPAAINVVAGDAQHGVVGTALRDSLVVQVSDHAGHPVAGKRVTFRSLSEGAGQLDPTAAKTDANGRAASLVLLGQVAGAWELEADVATMGGLLAAKLHVVGDPGPADSMFAAAGEKQSGAVGELLGDSLTVGVVDRFGNLIAGATVAWKALGGGSVSAGQTTTGPDGRASVARRLGPAAGSQSATATLQGVHGSPITFTHQALPGTPSAVKITTQPPEMVSSGQTFPVQPVVEVRDEAGNLLDGLVVTATIKSGGGTLGGNTGVATRDGVARFSDLSILGDPGARTLRFQAGSVSTVSRTVSVTGTAQAELGEWSAPFNWPVVAVHLHQLPSGDVISWGLTGGPQLWNPGSGSFSSVPSSSLLFCSGHAFLPDGHLLVAGGHIASDRGLSHTNIFDPVSRTWTQVASMAQGRWYPTVTALANGELLTVGGADSNMAIVKVPEVWNGAAWRQLPGASLELRYYPWLFQAPNGKVFYAGLSPSTRYLDTQGSGSWSPVATSRYGAREQGTAVMYEPGKVLIVGGGGGDIGTFPTASAETIDLNGSSPSWRNTAPMAFPRRHLNATLLPTGEVLVTGGTSGSGFSDVAGVVHEAEIWNPATGTWKTLAANTVERLYHSTAILRPDGRVLVAGSGALAGIVSQLSAELYSPPYLFRGIRPTVTGVPATISYGSSFSLATSDPTSIAKVTLLRLGSVTHSFDQNQRFLSLTFQSQTGGLTVTAPASGNLAPPGDYMLFLVSDAGVPSLGQFVRVQ